MSALALIGYGESVYTRAVRIALAELRLDYDWTGVDPFSSGGQKALAAWHPFGRVPLLAHAGFRIFETWAILTCLDAGFRTGNQPTAKQAAHAAQLAGIVGPHGCWPMVRQVARGKEMLSGYPHLSAWTTRLAQRDSAMTTQIGQKETMV